MEKRRGEERLTSRFCPHTHTHTACPQVICFLGGGWWSGLWVESSSPPSLLPLSTLCLCLLLRQFIHLRHVCNGALSISSYLQTTLRRQAVFACMPATFYPILEEGFTHTHCPCLHCTFYTHTGLHSTFPFLPPSVAFAPPAFTPLC